MKQKYIFVFLAVVALSANVAGILYESFWLKKSSEAVFIFCLLAFYFRRLPFKNVNFLFFSMFLIGAVCASLFTRFWYFEELSLGLWMGAYIFLVRDGAGHTEHEKGSRFTTLYFLGVLGAYVYLLFLHILEIERSINNSLILSLYIVYYLNVLVFAGVALIYYLNSFSRKSVFFVGLTLSFIFSDVLRDMEVFYFRDLSVELTGSLIRFAGIKMVFLFFITREKKLRLLHLV